MIYFYMLIMVQVIIESLPISSSTHVLLLEKGALFFEAYYAVGYTSFMQQYASYLPAFDYMLHGFTACEVACFFRSQWWLLLYNWRRCFFIIIKLIVFTCIADSITVFFFCVFKLLPVMSYKIGLLITVLLLYSLRFVPEAENIKKERLISGVQSERSNIWDIGRWQIHVVNRSCDIFSAVVLGCAQGLAFMPGVSRFAIVYVVSRWLGFNARKGLAVTWMIFWPLLVAASIKGAYQLMVSSVMSLLLTGPVVMVMGVATVVGYAAFCGAAYAAYNNKFWLFSGYVAVITVIALLMG